MNVLANTTLRTTFHIRNAAAHAAKCNRADGIGAAKQIAPPRIRKPIAYTDRLTKSEVRFSPLSKLLKYFGELLCDETSKTTWSLGE